MKKIAFALLLAAVTFSSCKKDNDNNNSGSVTDVLYKHAPATQSFNVNAQSGGTITTTRGIKFIIPANAFANGSGNMVTGNVAIQVREYFTNSDMIFGNVSTVTADSTLLVTGGMFHISASANGNTLSLVPGKEIEARISSGGTLNPDFDVFSGTENTSLSSNQVQWVESSGKWVGRIDTANGMPYYAFTIPGLNWWNLDHYPDLGNGRTKVSVTLPSGYSNTNSMVMLLMPDNGAIFLPGDPVTHDFNTSHYAVPIGEMVKVLSISNNNGLHYNLQTVTVVNNMSISVTSLQSTTENDLVTLVQGL